MKLYHGSVEIIKNPEIRIPSHTLDYGAGFYLTTSIDQATSWVKRRLKEKKMTEGFVNVYDFDKDAMASLKSLIFEGPTDEWVDFVMNNRTVKGFTHDYDIVYGPVANDRVYASFALYEARLLNKQELIRELRTYKLVDQYLFHTERALPLLSYESIKKVLL